MEELDDLFTLIIEQHKRIFPLATIDTQIKKLSEEIKELRDETKDEDREKEWGDVLYVTISLLRFPEIKDLTGALLYWFYTARSTNIKEKARDVLTYTINKVEERNNKGAYGWTGAAYERNKAL